MTSKALIDRAIAKNPTIKPNRIRAALAPRKHLEADEQARVIEWTHWAYRHHSAAFPMLHLIHCSLNGVKLSPKQACRAKAQGMRRGVCDLFLPYPRNGKCGLFIELKIEGNKPTPDQAAFIRDVESVGYEAHVCYGWREAVDVIKKYYGAEVG